MFRILDVEQNKTFSIDFPKLTRLPEKGEIITIKGRAYKIFNFNTIVEDGDAIIVIMVRPN